MRKNYTFKVNPAQPDAERIRKHQNFDQFLASYQVGPPVSTVRPHRIRTLAVYRIVAAVAAAALLFFLLRPIVLPQTASPEQLRAEALAFFASQPVVAPPFPSIQHPITSESVNSQEGMSFPLYGGGEIRIPATAFVNAKGKKVSGRVDVQYRTYRNQADFLVSGIPMEYERDQENLQLASVGVIEVFAYQNGQPLQLAPGKSIEVSFSEERFDKPSPIIPQPRVLFLNREDNKGWQEGLASAVRQEKDITPVDTLGHLAVFYADFRQKVEVLNQQWQREKEKVAAALLPPKKPEKPRIGAGDRPSFDLDLGAGTGISWKGDPNQTDPQRLENTTWIVSEKSGDFDLRALSVVWAQIEIEPIGGREYKITFRQGDASEIVIVEPLLSPTEYDYLLAAYQENLTRWEEANRVYEEELTRQLAYLNDVHEDRLSAITSAYQEKLDSLTLGNQLSTRQRLVFSFSIPHLGIWNCATPFSPEKEQVIAQLETPDGRSFSGQSAYLIDRNLNTVYRFYLGENGALLRFDPSENSEFVLVVTDAAQHLAILSGEKLQSVLLAPNVVQPKIVLSDHQLVSSVEAIKDFLAI